MSATTPFKDVFISYGRKESLAFATKLFKRLEEAGHPTWFDHVNIPKGDDFQRRIDDGIRSAHNFVYIIAPHANASQFCLKEVELALSLGKKIIPILHVERDLDKIHSEIGARNWIYAREKEDSDKPLEQWEAIDDFEAAFADITALLNKEKDYITKHTELLWNAIEWQSKQRQTQFLLVGKERQEAEEWLLTEFTPPKQPPCKPTDLHCQYICEARKNAENLMTDVFICYDTSDKDIRDKVINSLARHAVTTWTHDQDIAQGIKYSRAIEEGIEQADNFLFFISPESLQSKYCQREVRHALKMNKRVLPLLIRETEENNLKSFKDVSGLNLMALQYIDFTDNQVQNDYDADIDQILNLLKKDQAYYEQHKILLARAIQWEKEGRKNAFLLRGYNLENAATWLQLNEKRTQHAPSELHRTLIQASQAAKGSLGTEAFISYSRKDADFARDLNLKLQEAGKTTWFDQESISSGVDFEKEIFKGIDGADNIVFILSPDSVESEYCEREVLYATSKNKRFITLLHRETNPSTMPEPLRVINWIDFTESGSKTFDKAFAALVQAIELDQVHAHQHTILQQRATEWQENDQSLDFLLNASACANALIWQSEAKGKSPKTTELQQNYIASSKKAIDETEAKEKAIALSLKKRLSLARIAIAIAILLLGVAGYFVYQSNRNLKAAKLYSKRADEARYKAMASDSLAQLQAKEAKRQESIARIESDRAAQQKLIADEQTKIAESQTREVINQRENALKAEAFARQQQFAAEREKDRAIENGQKAIKAQELADSSAVVANRLSMFAISKTLAIKSVEQSNNVLQALLAKQMYIFHQRVGGDPLDPDIYNSLYYALKNNMEERFNVLQGNVDAISEVKFLDGTMYTASEDGSIWMSDMNLDRNSYKQFITSENKIFRSMFLDADINLIACGTQEGDIMLFDKVTGEIKRELKGHEGPVIEVMMLNNRTMLSAGGDNQVLLWNITGERYTQLYKSDADILSMRLSNDGRYLGIGLSTGTIVLLDALNQYSPILFSKDDMKEPIWAIAFSPDNKQIVLGDEIGQIHIYDLKTRALQFTLRGGISARVSQLKFSRDGKFLASASFDGSARLWQPEDYNIQPIILKDHSSWITSLDFTPDNKQLITGSVIGEIKKWELTTRAMADQLCNKVDRNMTFKEWETYLGKDIYYEKTCPSLAYPNE